MGIDAEKIEEIINAHSETVSALKEERDRYKTDAEKYKADAEKLPDVEKELNDLKKSVEKDGSFEKKYNDLKTEYDKYKNDVDTEKTTAKKTAAYKALLKEAGVSEKRIDTILKVSDISGIELAEDGKIKDAEERTKSIKEEWADFIETSGTKGANTNTPPEGNGGNGDKPSRAAQMYKEYLANKYGTVEDKK
jgi:hypothetical protein